MDEIVTLLKRLVLSVGHDVTCAATKLPCTCMKSAELRLAHGEACRVLRERGELK